MGGRLIRDWLSFPLTDEKEIVARQNKVQLFTDNVSFLRKVRELLDGILDIERLAGRIAMDRAHAKDLQALKNSINIWLKAKGALEEKILIVIDLIANLLGGTVVFVHGFQSVVFHSLIKQY